MAKSDYGFSFSLIGTLISKMGFLLSFLYTTGWILLSFSHRWQCKISKPLEWLSGYKYCDEKVLTASISAYSLLIGSCIGLLVGYTAQKTKTHALFFYLCFLVRGVSLMVLGLYDEKLTNIWIIVCFVSLQTGSLCQS